MNNVHNHHRCVSLYLSCSDVNKEKESGEGDTIDNVSSEDIWVFYIVNVAFIILIHGPRMIKVAGEPVEATNLWFN